MIEKILDSRMLKMAHKLLPQTMLKIRFIFGSILLVMGIILVAVTVLDDGLGISLVPVGLILFIVALLFYAATCEKTYFGFRLYHKPVEPFPCSSGISEPRHFPS